MMSPITEAKRTIRQRALALSIAVVVALGLGWGCSIQPDGTLYGQTSKRVSPLKGRHKDAPVYKLQKTFHDVYELYKESVVFISTERVVGGRRGRLMEPFPELAPRRRKATGLGTGFILSEDGYIATNHHVVANMDKIRVKVGHKMYSARVIGTDKLSDVALLKIDGTGFKPAYIGDSDKVRVGDWALAIGNPFGLDKTFTVGVISATVREDSAGNAHIQTDASINPGNSGGPLINLDGEVIGINRMIYSRTGGSLGIGFAIPMNIAQEILGQLRKHKKVKRGYIGVQIARLSEAHAKELGLENNHGALVGNVYRGTPAAKAGLKQLDVIRKVDGKKIKSFKDLVRAVGRKEVGKTVKLEVWRKKKSIVLWVTIEERPTR